MKFTPLILSALLALGAGAPLLANAQQSTHRGMMANLRTLNLSDQQRTQIRQIVTQYRSAHPKGSDPDPQARKAMRDQVMAVLTPDQQSAFKANAQRARQQRKQLEENARPPQPEATPS
jgi:Spy/CpxP family protein refolding chaperone